MEFFTTLLMLHLLVDEHNRPAHPYRAPYKMSVDMAAVLDFDNDPSKWRRLKVVQIVPFCDLEKKKWKKFISNYHFFLHCHFILFVHFFCSWSNASKRYRFFVYTTHKNSFKPIAFAESSM